MKKGKIGFLAIVLVFSLCWSGAKAGWDLDRDFETALTNPNGAWSYGYIDGTGFHLFNDLVTGLDQGSEHLAWRLPNDWDSHGNIQKILEGQPNFEAYTSYRYGGEMCSGPGAVGIKTTVRWTCRAADSYLVTSAWQ